MRLTLNLHDYIDKYLDISNDNEVWCPVCYEDIMSDCKESNMRHLIDCYKTLRVETGLRLYKEDNGIYPEDLATFSAKVNDDVRLEMLSYYVAYANQQKHL